MKDALVRVSASGQGRRAVLVDKVPRYIPHIPGFHSVALSWSPDGSQIAFAADGSRWSMPSALYIVDADGSALRKVPNSGRGWNPVWQPQ